MDFDQFFEAGFGIVDKRHQYQHGSLGGKWRSRQVFQGHRSALVFCDMWIHGKIGIKPLEFPYEDQKTAQAHLTSNLFMVNLITINLR